MNLIATIIYFTWFLSEVLLGRLLRSKKSDKQHADKGTLYLLWILIIVGIWSAIFIAKMFSVQIINSNLITYFGLAIIVIGIVLRLLIVKSLGQFFTVNVTIKQNHQLKVDGFYNYLRHPSYFASLLTCIGFGISLNNWFSLVTILTLVLIAFLVRINIEEKLLIEHFGNQYIEYKKNTKGLIPFIY